MTSKAKSAYFLFTEAHRASVKGELQAQRGSDAKVSVADVAKELGQRWKALSEEERSTWQARAAEAKAAAQEAAAQEAAAAAGEDDDQQDAPAHVQQPAQAPPLPLSLVKRLMMVDPDVSRVSADALLAVAQATDLFLGLLTNKMTAACATASRGKRRTLKLEDFSSAVKTDRRLVEAGLRDVLALASAAAEQAAATRKATTAARGEKDAASDAMQQEQEQQEVGPEGEGGALSAHRQQGCSSRKRARRTSSAQGPVQGGALEGAALPDDAGAEGGAEDGPAARGEEPEGERENRPRAAEGKGRGRPAGSASGKKGAGAGGKGKACAAAPAGAATRITAFFSRAGG